MPDISMCLALTCPARRDCLRHEASGTRPNPDRQTYGGFAPDERGKCDHFVGAERERGA